MLNVPSNWNTGIYLAKFTDAAALQWYIPFDVRGNAHALYVIVTPNTIFATYNAWGGYSLYEGRTRIGIGNLPQGMKVSLDRPDIQDHGSAQVLYGMAPAIHWLEHQGYDLSYMSDVDLQEDPHRITATSCLSFSRPRRILDERDAQWTDSIYWTLAFDNCRFQTHRACASSSLVVPSMQKLLSNVMSALIVQHHSTEELDRVGFVGI